MHHSATATSTSTAILPSILARLARLKRVEIQVGEVVIRRRRERVGFESIQIQSVETILIATVTSNQTLLPHSLLIRSSSSSCTGTSQPPNPSRTATWLLRAHTLDRPRSSVLDMSPRSSIFVIYPGSTHACLGSDTCVSGRLCITCHPRRSSYSACYSSSSDSAPHSCCCCAAAAATAAVHFRLQNSRMSCEERR